jgi:O-antigen biosynthesis protein
VRLLRRRPAGAEGPVQHKDVLFVFELPGAWARYRCEHQAEQLQRDGRSSDVVHLDRVDLAAAVDRYDSFVLNRVSWNDAIASFVDSAAAAGKPVVFDTDDLVFEPDLGRYLAFMDRWPEESRRAEWGRMDAYRQTLEACGRATVSTEPLAEAARKRVPDVGIVHNVVSAEMIRLADAALASSAEGSENVTVAYLSGTGTHDRDFLEAADAVLAALASSPRVRFLAVGKLQLDDRFDRFGSRVSRLPLQPWQALPAILTGVDVNLAPLERDNPFTRCKSCVKYLEAALVGVPTIASPRPDFVRVIEHGRNGFLADDPDTWREALEALLESPELRGRAGAHARSDVLATHTTGAL